MSIVEAVPVPAWVSSREKPEDVERGQVSFFIRLAALYHNESGNVSELSTALGLSSTVLHMAMKRGQVTAEVAVAIEQAVGRPLFPRELFRPDLFTLPRE